jgi:uroporphyrinogen decarboxylase
MRQAGRYLPEYRAMRANARGFVELCLDPAMAAEVTLQPVRRFDLDAAIIFSDILIVPFALGVNLWFEEGEGPRLDPVRDIGAFRRMRTELDAAITSRVYEALQRVRAELSPDVALLGFCGAPWTVATYLIAGQGTADQAPAKRLMREQPELFGRIMGNLTKATADHLIGQIDAGADAVQLFDTWAGSLSEDEFERFSIAPAKEIVSKVRKERPGARLILFPKGASLQSLVKLVESCGPNALSLAATADRKALRVRLDGRCALQGNLSPEILRDGGEPLDHAVDQILRDFEGARHIFNLGHGILKETPIAHVERMIARVRGCR